MLDLTQLTSKTYPIKLLDGSILNIKKPNNELFKQTFKMSKLMESNEGKEKLIDTLYNYITKIFNRNLDGKIFTQKEIESMFDYDVAMYVIQDYFNFVQGVAENLNF